MLCSTVDKRRWYDMISWQRLIALQSKTRRPENLIRLVRRKCDHRHTNFSSQAGILFVAESRLLFVQQDTPSLKFFNRAEKGPCALRHHQSGIGMPSVFFKRSSKSSVRHTANIVLRSPDENIWQHPSPITSKKVSQLICFQHLNLKSALTISNLESQISNRIHCLPNG